MLERIRRSETLTKARLRFDAHPWLGRVRKSVWLAAGVALLAVLWLASGSLALFSRPEPAPPAAVANGAPAAQAPQTPPRVRVVSSVASPQILDLSVAGQTEAARIVEVKAETQGRVTQVMTRAGDRVVGGQPLLQIEIDDRKARLDEAAATLRQRQIEFDAATKLAEKGFRSQTAVAAAKAQLDGAEANMARMRLEIAKTTLRAPFAGVVASGHAEIGDYLGVGQSAATVIGLDPIEIVGSATEHDVGALRIGAPGSARLPDGRELKGKISFVAAIADPATRTYRFELQVPNPNYQVRDGLTAEIIVPAHRVTAHRVPSSALSLAESGQVGVKLVGPDNKIVFAPVKILAETPDGLLVAGLPEKVSLVTVGHEFVTVGQTVEPVGDQVTQIGTAQ